MAGNPKQIYEFGAFRLDLADRLLTQKGSPVALTPKAFEVLVWLIERRGHLVEKDELMQKVWADSIVEEGNLSRTIWMLRQALGDDRNGHGLIQTVPKHGYRFVADVEAIDVNSVDEGPQLVETELPNSHSIVLKAGCPREETLTTSAESHATSSPTFDRRVKSLWPFVIFVSAVMIVGGWLITRNSDLDPAPRPRS